MAEKTQPQSNAGVANEQVNTKNIDPGEIFHLLQNDRRRQILSYFLDNNGPVTIGDLATWIAARENDVAESAVSSDERRRVYISLYQSHLSKLDDKHIIHYDQETKEITAGPNLEVLLGPIEFERTFDQSTEMEATQTTGNDESRSESDDSPLWSYGWIPYYLGISLGGLASVVGSWLLALPSALLSIRVLNIILLGMFSFTLVGNLLQPWTPEHVGPS